MSERRFPPSFLWGASTAAHQIEGNNTNSDWWVLEHSGEDAISEPSGDAADSFHRYPQDIALLRDLGLGAYRFSFEWARIEPEQGFVSRAMLQHYRRMVDATQEAGLIPVVTLHHFTNPRWFADIGGWSAPHAVDAFARYVETVAPLLHDVPWVVTINEPNMVALMLGIREAVGTGIIARPSARATDILIAAHERARAILQPFAGATGWSVANQAYHAMPGCEEETAAYRRPREDVFLEAARDDDFIGVQAYLRTFIGKEGPVPVRQDVEHTLTGWEYFPDALGIAVRHTAAVTGGTPILVTENGIATADDQRRIDYTHDALAGLHDAMADGIDVRGYLHWSALDNYEWGSYRPTFGLIGWNPETFERSVKPSGRWLGRIAQTGLLSR